MNESWSSRSRAMSRCMTPGVARAGAMIAASAAVTSSLLSGLERIFWRRMTMGPPVGLMQRWANGERGSWLGHQVDVVRHAAWPAAAHGDEDAVVDPREL